MAKEYTMVSTRYSEDFTRDCNRLSREGWLPNGNVFSYNLTHSDNSISVRIAQQWSREIREHVTIPSTALEDREKLNELINYDFSKDKKLKFNYRLRKWLGWITL